MKDIVQCNLEFMDIMSIVNIKKNAHDIHEFQIPIKDENTKYKILILYISENTGHFQKLICITVFTIFSWYINNNKMCRKI